MDTPLVPAFPWLNSILLTGRWQFSAWLNCDSHVSDCTDDVCVCTGHHYTSAVVLMASGLLSLPHQQKHMGTFMFHKAPRLRGRRVKNKKRSRAKVTKSLFDPKCDGLPQCTKCILLRKVVKKRLKMSCETLCAALHPVHAPILFTLFLLACLL